MDRLIYTTLSGMRSAMARQTNIASNLANAQTPGFRADISEAQALWLRGDGVETRGYASQQVVAADMRAGTVTATGRPLDLALDGDAMFAVQAADGGEAYTRRGDFAVSGSGLLTTADGVPVLGDQGPIIVPPFDRIAVAPDGQISIVPAGGGDAAPQPAGRLKLVATEGSAIIKGVDGLFRAPDGGVLPESADARVQSGHLEGSNVSATEALVAMIEASRAWDNQIKLLGDARDMDAATADLMRLPN